MLPLLHVTPPALLQCFEPTFDKFSLRTVPVTGSKECTKVSSKGLLLCDVYRDFRLCNLNSASKIGSLISSAQGECGTASTVSPSQLVLLHLQHPKPV